MSGYYRRMNARTRFGAAFGLALLSVLPIVAKAQELGPPPPDGAPGAMAPAAAGTPNPARMASMREARAASERIRAQARLAMLAALTPQHRTQFGTLVGEFATAATPDLSVTAKQIDALLSVREARAIVVAEQTARTSFEATLTAAQRAQMQARMQAMKAAHPAGAMHEPSTDPGMMLLHTALGMGGRHEGPPGPR
jgi:Spy/CpxP family protein refolding chaperone